LVATRERREGWRMGEAMSISRFEPDKDFVRTSNWYVIFIKTYEERRFAERLQGELDASKYVVFVPTKDRSFRTKQEFQLHRMLLFPGYVFVASTDEPEMCYKTLKPIIFKDKMAYKLLGEEESSWCAVVDNRDKALLMRLMNKEFHIAAIEAVKVGHDVIIVDGAFAAFEGRVKKINKYRQTVDVEFATEFMGSVRTVTFALKMVERLG